MQSCLIRQHRQKHWEQQSRSYGLLKLRSFAGSDFVPQAVFNPILICFSVNFAIAISPESNAGPVA
jgi:hypothetical protein